MVATDRQEIVIPAPNQYKFTVVFVGLCFLLGVSMPFLAGWQLLTLGVCLFCIVTGVFSLILAWKRQHAPVLIINEEGIHSTDPLLTGKIKWEEMDALYRINARNSAVFAVDLSPDGLISLYGRLGKRIPQGLDITVPQQGLSIPETSLSISVDELLAQIRKRFSDTLERYHIDLDDELQPYEEESEAQTLNITVYPHRRRMIAWLVSGVISSVLCFLFFLFMLIVMIVIPSISHDGSAIAIAVFFVVMTVPAIWATWTIASFLSSHKPTLIINSEGVHIGRIYGSFEILLSWGEIEGIYLIGTTQLKQLSFRPKNTTAYLARFRLIQRILLRTNMTPIAIAQSYLEKPIEEIIHLVQTRYGSQLEHYHIQIHNRSNT